MVNLWRGIRFGLLVIFMAVLFIGLVLVTVSKAGGFNDSPHNWRNSPNNWDNSSHNWNNSRHNFNNSVNKFNNDRIIRGNSGKPSGFAVPKSGGGVNYFDLDGTRRGWR